jgi:acetyltransferase-like isoleucine patch superfamily enzyme
MLYLCGVDIHPTARVVSSVKIYSSGPLTIGEDTYIGAGALIGSGNGSIKIGNHCNVGPRAMIISGGHEIAATGPRAAGTGHSKPIVIEDGAWIAAGAIILGGVRIGQHSVIGAGGVVGEDIPEHCVAIGFPCRVIRSNRAQSE